MLFCVVNISTTKKDNKILWLVWEHTGHQKQNEKCYDKLYSVLSLLNIKW